MSASAPTCPKTRRAPLPKCSVATGSSTCRSSTRQLTHPSYRDDFGEVKRREVSGRTQAEVRARLREIRGRVEAGAPVKDAATTVGAWLDDCTTKALPASERKQATIDLYKTIARHHLAPKPGTVPLDRLRPSPSRSG